jgi:hypothetical protein
MSRAGGVLQAARQLDGVGKDVLPRSQVLVDVDAAVRVQHQARIAGQLDHGDVAEHAPRAQAVVSIEHSLEQRLGGDAALHQQLSAPSFDLGDGAGAERRSSPGSSISVKPRCRRKRSARPDRRLVADEQGFHELARRRLGQRLQHRLGRRAGHGDALGGRARHLAQQLVEVADHRRTSGAGRVAA